MVSTFTPNIQWEEPARGDDVGTWDVPVNNNGTLIDLVTGANTTINIGAGNVSLSVAQFRSRTLTFNSTLIQNTTITFPSSFTKDYVVGHLCTGSSAFTLTLQTTVAGGQVIGIPPGEYTSVINDGTNLRFMALDRVGTYHDFATTSVPAWITACTVPPYLQCVGNTFSSATYPQLAIFLGGTTLPDTRGRARLAVDAGTNRVTAGGCGLAGNTLFAGGGDQLMQVHSHGVSDPGHLHSGVYVNSNTQAFAGDTAGPPPNYGNFGNSNAAFTGISIGNAGSGGAQNMPPAYVGGITMIRAA
jgi:hypothetical protein